MIMKNMKILIFLHGTIIMHKNAKGRSREERVKQSLAREPSVLDYINYIPVGCAVNKLRKWEKQGAMIIYFSSHETPADVKKDKAVLKKYGFPTGRVVFRKDGKTYKYITEKILPDVLIEDDCESIGGEKEMTITNVSPSIKKEIKLIVVKEFSGIDGLPDNLYQLLKGK